MSAGLYDAAFSTLGRIYGQDARQHITTLTLFGGFASTVCWPLSAFFLQELGWRGACVAYAAIQLVVCLGIYLLALPREQRNGATEAMPAAETSTGRESAHPLTIFILLAVTITIASMLSTVMSVHLLTILQARDITLAAAVALGALVGPSQVGARFIEMLIGKYHHPIWTKVASVSFLAIGLGLLWGHLPVIALTLVFYGAGIGLESIARATLPLGAVRRQELRADHGPARAAQPDRPGRRAVDRSLPDRPVGHRRRAGDARRRRVHQCAARAVPVRGTAQSQPIAISPNVWGRRPGLSPDLPVSRSSQRNSSAARIAPTISAPMNHGTSIGRMPAKVSVRLRAMATAGLAKQVDAVNQ